MANKNSIILDIGARIDKTWQASLNNIGTDLKRVGNAVHNQMQAINKSGDAFTKYSAKADDARVSLTKLEQRLKELQKIEEGAKTGTAVDTSILSERDKRGIVRRARTDDYEEKIAKDIIDTGTAIQNTKKQVVNYEKEIDKLSAKLETLKEGTKSYNNQKTLLDETKEKSEAAKNKIIELEAHLKTLKTFENIKTTSPLVTEKVLDRVQDEIPKVQNQINALNNKITEYDSVIRNSEQQTETSLANLRQIYKQYLLNGIVKILNTVIQAFVRLGKTAVKWLGKMTGVFSKTVSQAIGLQQAVRLLVQYGFGFRSLYYLVRRLRTGIEQGFEYLGGAVKSSKKTINGFSEEVRELLNTLKELVYYLKSAAAAMLQPFMPLINSIIPKLVAWFNALAIAVANFIATLTGQSKIFVASTNLEDYANALDQVAGSANKAREALGAYDKLNVINDDKSGGGSGEFDTSGWFTEQPVEPSQLAQMIKEAWEKADFTEVGILIGEKFKAMLESIDWENKIFPMVEKIAKSVATFINGFISVENLGADIGSAVANVFNAITLYVKTFAETIKWDELGKFIVDGINGFLETFDAAQIGQALYSFADGILTTLGIIFEKSDSAKLGESISLFFENLNIPDLASKLISVAKKFAEAFAEALQSWAKTDPESFGIAAALVSASALTKLVGLSIPIMLQLGTAGIIDYKSIFAGVSLTSAISDASSKISVFCLKTIPDFFKSIPGALSNAVQNILSFVGAAWFQIGQYFTNGGTLITALQDGIASLWGVIQAHPIVATVAAIALLVGAFIDAYNSDEEFRKSVNDLWEKSIKPTFDAVKSAAVEIWNESLQPLWENLKGLIGDIFDLLRPVLDFIVLDFVPGIMTIINRLIPFLKPIITTIIGLVDSVMTVLRGIIQFLTGVFTGDWNRAWEGIKTIFKGVWDGIVAIGKGAVNLVIGIINNLISGFVQGINNVINLINNMASIDIKNPFTGKSVFKWQANFGNLTAPQIPYLAQGAVIPPNRQFLAMLGDQSSGVNVEAPLDTIRQALVEALAESSANAPIVLQLDGKVIAKTVWDENEKRYKQLGKYAY